MPVKYSQAPISEVICGIFFKSNFLLNNSVFFHLLAKFSKDYPGIQTHPVGPDDEVANGSINATIDYPSAGFSTYRFSATDGGWQILLQQNMLTLHWVRQDNEQVGNYPGFKSVYGEFREIFEFLKSLVGADELLHTQIKNYYLSYVDRVDLEPFKHAGRTISDILTIPAPGFALNEIKYKADNYFARFSTPCEAINGNAIMSVNSPTVIPFGQILIVDNKVKGMPATLQHIDAWFESAHSIQTSFFENIFKPDILEQWK